MPDDGRALRSLLIPIQGDPLLLPSAVVAEVTSFTEPAPLEDAPDWLLGRIDWRQHKLPIVCMETAMGEPGPADYGHRARVIVLYNLNESLQLPFYGVVASGIPRAYLASRENIQSLTENDAQAFVLERVGIKPEGTAIIPDLDGIQEALLGAQRALSASATGS